MILVDDADVLTVRKPEEAEVLRLLQVAVQVVKDLAEEERGEGGKRGERRQEDKREDGRRGDVTGEENTLHSEWRTPCPRPRVTQSEICWITPSFLGLSCLTQKVHEKQPSI